MMLSSAICRQAIALLKSTTAQLLTPACHNLQQAWLSSSSTLQHLVNHQHDCSSDTSRQPDKYRGVRKVGNKWKAYISIPKHLRPSSHGRKTIWKCGFHHPEAAAQAADIMQLVYHGEAAHLNFPRSTYSDQQVAELRAELLAKQGNPSMQARPCTNDPSGFKAAIAAAAERVAGLHDSSRELVGCSQKLDGTGNVQMRAKETMQYCILIRTETEAACAYDLLRMAMHGLTHSVNFPPDSYNSSWVEAAARDIQLTRPGMLESAQLGPAPPDYHCVEAGRAADAAVAAEAAAAIAAGVKVNSETTGCYVKEGRATIQTSKKGKVPGIEGRYMYQPYYSAGTALLAPCAVDLMHLASGKPAVNLPSHSYKDSSIAAMRGWMHLEASRKAAWAAKKKQIERPKQRSKKVTGKQLGRG